MAKTVTKIIKGNHFKFKYDPDKMKAFLEVIEEDLVLLILRFREDLEFPVLEDEDELLHEQTH